MIKNSILFFITTVLLVTGQAFWKIAASQVSGFVDKLDLAIKVFSNLYFLAGCLFYIIATGLWIYLLGQYEYSKIYPIFVGTCVIISLFAGIIFFRENTGLMYKILGAAFVIGGIVLITKA